MYQQTLKETKEETRLLLMTRSEMITKMMSMKNIIIIIRVTVGVTNTMITTNYDKY